MAYRTYVGNIGTEIILNVGVNIETATVLRIDYKKPNDDIGSWTAESNSRTSLSYTTKEGDLDVAGEWRLQAYVEMPGWTGRGTTALLLVDAKFD